MKFAKKKETGSVKRTVLRILCVILSLVLVVLIAGTAYLESLLNMINKAPSGQNGSTLSQEEIDAILNQTDEVDPTYDGPFLNGSDVTWGSDAFETIGHGDHIINILLIGQDRREGEGRSRSDAMILCTINKSTNTLTMTSFMRDMYVQIPGYRDNRINASYAIGGMELLDACIEKNFGVQIDGNVEVDFSGFQQVIDKIGGVDVELTSAEANYLNERGNWDIENNAGTWNLKAGTNHLNGSQALAYSRIRYIGNGDFGRTNRQRTVLNALIEKAKTMSITELNSLLRELLPLLTTDMKDSDILSCAAQLFALLPQLTLNTVRLPADGAYTMTMIDGMSVLLPDLEKNRQILKEIMAE